MGALRLSLGRENTGEDIAYLLDTLPGIVSRIQASIPGLSGQAVHGKP
jgi:cysteine sulfinate desulfinase/cysteine desulfurase-like protein